MTLLESFYIGFFTFSFALGAILEGFGRLEVRLKYIFHITLQYDHQLPPTSLKLVSNWRSHALPSAMPGHRCHSHARPRLQRCQLEQLMADINSQLMAERNTQLMAERTKCFGCQVFRTKVHR